MGGGTKRLAIQLTCQSPVPPYYHSLASVWCLFVGRVEGIGNMGEGRGGVKRWSMHLIAIGRAVIQVVCLLSLAFYYIGYLRPIGKIYMVFHCYSLSDPSPGHQDLMMLGTIAITMI